MSVFDPSAPGRVSVVICAYDQRRLPLTRAAVAAALAQVPAPEVVLVIDHNPALLESMQAEFGDRAIVLANADGRGLSGARNTGVRASSGSVVAFLDDDAVPGEGWLATLTAPFADPHVLAAGGHAVPVWEPRQPSWFPDEFLWVVGCSYAGQKREGATRNVLGCNMAFRRSTLERLGGFDPSLGRRGNRPLGCEETELCIRATKVVPDGEVVLVEGCEVRHFVSADRHTAGYFFRRCFMEGISKARLSSLSGAGSMSSERGHLLSVLPRAFVRDLFAPLRGDMSGPVRAFALAAGTVTTVVGFLAGPVRASDRTPEPLPDAAPTQDMAGGER